MNDSCPACGHPVRPDQVEKCPECGHEIKPGGREEYFVRPVPSSGVVPGQRLGRYEIIEDLGRGGMAAVCKARELDTGRTVALKLLPPELHSSRQHVDAFLRESEAVERLEHPGIASVLEAGCHGGRYYFAMDYVEGRSMAEVIARGRLLPEEAARIVAEAARAAGAAHRAGVVHRDLKPNNIMVADDGRAVVLDFGLSALYDEPDKPDEPAETDGRIVGTPAYMSPEQASPESGRPVGPAADIYSLGAVLYEAVTGRPPYTGVDSPGVVAQVQRSAPPPPRTFAPGLSPRLEGVILKAMARRPEDRYAGADELADDLELFRGGDSVRARKPGLAVEIRSGLWKVRRLAAHWALPAGLILAGLAFLVYLAVMAVLHYLGPS